MIQSFSDKTTELFFISGKVKKKVGWKNIAKIAKRKLDMLHFAEYIDDLKSPPANRLELLKGKWKGWYSIRINGQWRIVFKWGSKGPDNVCIVDYH